MLILQHIKYHLVGSLESGIVCSTVTPGLRLTARTELLEKQAFHCPSTGMAYGISLYIHWPELVHGST